MARLYVDENFPLDVVKLLRNMGHDVLTAREAGQAGRKIPDERVLEFARAIDRAVLTLNCWDFRRLHRRGVGHAGIIGCSSDANLGRMAVAIDGQVASTVLSNGSLVGQYVSVVKPSR